MQAVFGHVTEFVTGTGQGHRKPVEQAPAYLPGTMLARREVFDEVGLFDISLTVGEFVDWYSRATTRSLITKMLPDIVLRRRLHDNNMGLRHQASMTDYVSVLKAHLDRRRQGTSQCLRTQSIHALLLETHFGQRRPLAIQKLTQAELLALQVIYGNDNQARQSWTRFSQAGFDIDSLYLTASRGLLPMLSQRVSKLFCDDPWLGKMRGYYRYIWTKNQFQLNTVTNILRSFRDNQVKSILIGDAAMLLGQYQDYGMRPIGTSSVLVAFLGLCQSC